MSRHHTLATVITDEQEANLRKGAEGLMNLPPDQPFDMERYRSDDSEPPDPHDCGTAGCALGYFPMWIPPQEGEKHWSDYEARVTGLGSSYGNGSWGWCFGADWAGIDNTPQGAARRILHLLDNGLPDDWQDQMNGDAPYIFAEATS
jgi:hypothetical protein